MAGLPVPTSFPVSAAAHLRHLPCIHQLSPPAPCAYLTTTLVHAGWFHEVTSYSTADSPTHLALNFWYHPPDNLGSSGNDSASGAALLRQPYRWVGIVVGMKKVPRVVCNHTLLAAMCRLREPMWS